MRIIHTLLIVLVLFAASSVQAQNEIRTPPNTGFVPPLIATYGDGDLGRSAVWLDNRTIAAAGARGVWIVDAIPIIESENNLNFPLEKHILEHPGGVNSVAVNLEIMQLASVGWQTVRVWDLTTKTLITEFPGTDNAIAFSPDGSLLLTTEPIEDGHQTQVLIWDTSNYSEPRGIIPHFEWLMERIVFSPDGTLVAISEVYTGSCEDYPTTTVSVWRVENGLPSAAPLYSVNTFLDNTPFVFASDSDHLVFPKRDFESATLRLLDATTGEVVNEVADAQVDQLFIGADNQLMYRTVAFTGTKWWRWNMSDAAPESLTDGAREEYRSVIGAVSPDGQYVLLPDNVEIFIAQASNLGYVGNIWGKTYTTGFPFNDTHLTPWTMNSDELLSRLDAIDWAVLLSADGSVRVRESMGEEYYDNGYDAIFTFENVTENQILSTVTIQPPLLMNRMKISADGEYFVTQTISQIGCGNGAEMIVWDTHTGEPITRIFTADWDSVFTLSPDNTLMAWSIREQIVLTRLIDGAELGRWRAHGRGVNALVFSSDSQLLLTHGEDSLVRAWDVSAAQ